MKTFLRGILAFATMAGVVLVAPAAAHAEDCPAACWTSKTVADAPYTYWAGEAFFDSLGEHMYVTDFHKDGAGVRVHFSVDYGAWQQRTNTKGADNQVDYNLDYPENLSFRFFVCLENNGTNLAGTCSKMIYAHT